MHEKRIAAMKIGHHCLILAIYGLLLLIFGSVWGRRTVANLVFSRIYYRC